MSKFTYAFLVKTVLAAGLVTASATVATTVYAAPASQVVAAKNLNQLLINTKSMTADFSQTTLVGKKSKHFSGRMSVQRQNQFRWETIKPAKQLIVANGNTLWIYDEDLKQATKQSVANQVGDTPALLLSGSPEQIAQNFSVSQPNAAKNYYLLTPKNKNATFKSLSISFNGGKPVMMVLDDNVGQVTTIRFSNIAMNKKIPAATFGFKPPADVDVIEQ